MDIVNRAKNIIMKPSAEWEAIRLEPMTIAEMFKGYVMILAAIPAIAGFIGNVLVGTSMFGTHTRMAFGTGIVYAILTYGFSLLSVYVIGLIIDYLAPTFGVQKDKAGSIKVAAFAYTPAWLAGIFGIIPMLSVLGIVGLYSLYLLWVGLRIVKEVPQDKMLGYYLLVIVLAIVYSVVAGMIIGAATMTGGMM